MTEHRLTEIAARIVIGSDRDELNELLDSLNHPTALNELLDELAETSDLDGLLDDLDGRKVR